MQTVDRQSYILWQDGYLIKDGVLVDERACQLADEALGRGETIALLENNRIVSYVISEEECYREVLEL